MQYALRARRRCMDRVAASPPGSGERSGFLETAGHRLEAAVDRAASKLSAAVPDFAARYGRSPHDLITTLATRADCVGGAFYIQDAILCRSRVRQRRRRAERGLRRRQRRERRCVSGVRELKATRWRCGRAAALPASSKQPAAEAPLGARRLARISARSLTHGSGRSAASGPTSAAPARSR
jgi:hypothetical protein